MQTSSALDYLTIGHIACDLTSNGHQLGGTVTYASLTAYALGKRVGIVTATGQDVSLKPINHLPRKGLRVAQSTTFENRYTPNGRIQTLHHTAPPLTPDLIPNAWKNTPIVHLGPVIHEIDISMLELFPDAFIGVTPQGWLRQWDQTGLVTHRNWTEYTDIFPRVNAAIFSIEDVVQNETLIEEMADVCPLLVVTEGPNGSRLFLDGQATHVPAPPMHEVDATGAGDIFAAAFFIQYHQTHNPLEAAYFATHLAAHSVTRPGLAGIPTAEELSALDFAGT